MCDLFGPPRFLCAFTRYSVYQDRTYVYIHGRYKDKNVGCLMRIYKGTNNELNMDELGDIVPVSETAAFLDREKVDVIANVAYGILGFIRFTMGYYLVVITKRKKLGKLGHHTIYSVEKTMMVHVFVPSRVNEALNRDELRLKDLFFCKDFFFSYTYDLALSVQRNWADKKRVRADDPFYVDPTYFRFVWNKKLLEPFRRGPRRWRRWVLPVVHGFIGHASCSASGAPFDIALIARRSSLFAGTRYRKRGVNPDGQAANDVETEQVVWDDSMRHFNRGRVLSFTQMRASVPLFWSQEAKGMHFKPPFMYVRCDPTLAAFRNHVADLFQRYGEPLLFINLMKNKFQDSHESKLSHFFEDAIELLNAELPRDQQIVYKALDLKNAQRPIYELLTKISREIVSAVGFLHYDHDVQPVRLQKGSLRTNCVDCLDRTNVLQFFVGLEVLEHQLSALSVLPPKTDKALLDFSQEIVSVLEEMYDFMGDSLALQYAGSVAHKKYQLLPRPRIMKNSKELLTSVHRHYSNSFGDGDKQNSMNLLLGVYLPTIHPRPWAHDGLDSWLHHGVLHDDYDPKNWWEAPLAKWVEQAIAPFENDERSEDGDTTPWFNFVYKNHKPWTYFNKLTTQAGSTRLCLKVNPDNRRASTSHMRVYRLWEEQHQPENLVRGSAPAEDEWRQALFDYQAGEDAYIQYIDVRRSMRRVRHAVESRDAKFQMCDSNIFANTEKYAPSSMDSTFYTGLGIDQKIVELFQQYFMLPRTGFDSISTLQRYFLWLRRFCSFFCQPPPGTENGKDSKDSKDSKSSLYGRALLKQDRLAAARDGASQAQSQFPATHSQKSRARWRDHPPGPQLMVQQRIDEDDEENPTDGQGKKIEFIDWTGQQELVSEPQESDRRQRGRSQRRLTRGSVASAKAQVKVKVLLQRAKICVSCNDLFVRKDLTRSTCLPCKEKAKALVELYARNDNAFGIHSATPKSLYGDAVRQRRPGELKNGRLVSSLGRKWILGMETALPEVTDFVPSWKRIVEWETHSDYAPLPEPARLPEVPPALCEPFQFEKKARCLWSFAENEDEFNPTSIFNGCLQTEMAMAFDLLF
eukprot:GEMP01003067.1.p1 GENE.GEMP01003067.1~~GEMP01003067.1.p1  ORF type:complete len:1086 (+),score=196.16 GEMP01003067.1:209-3466(+)